MCNSLKIWNGGCQMVKKWVHLEGLIIFMSMIYIYYEFDYNWWIFILFLLTPDIAMFAYIINNRIGAIIYNLVHTYTISIPFLIFGIMMNNNLIIMVGIIWSAHNGIDRLFGYGLKYTTAFQHTHLQKL